MLIRATLLSKTGIYKIERAGKNRYIGQTQVSFKERWQEHKNPSKHQQNYPIYKAFSKYGIENFSFSIVEILHSVSTEEMLERESYYIDLYSSQCKNGGLNYDRPKWNEKLDKEVEEAIFQDLINGLTNREVAEKYKISNGLCSLIRSGRRHKREDIEYPILSTADQEYFNKYLQIYDLLMNTQLSIIEISKKLSVDPHVIRNVFHNRPPKKIRERFPYFLTDSFPIRKTYKDLSASKTVFIKDRQRYGYRKCMYCHADFEAISYKQKYCSSKCANQANRRTCRPSRSELKDLIRTVPFLQLSKRFGVSDNAIRKWCKSMNLPWKSSDIKSYSDEEWEQEAWQQ